MHQQILYYYDYYTKSNTELELEADLRGHCHSRTDVGP